MRSLKAWFWRRAYHRYQFRAPDNFLYLMIFLWSFFWLPVWALAFYQMPSAWLGLASMAILWVGLPLTYGIAKRVVYREYERAGRDGLLRKYLEYSQT